jgi:hypothetical protein
MKRDMECDLRREMKREMKRGKPIAHIRWAGIWQTISFFTGIAAVYLLALSGFKGVLYKLIVAHLANSLPSVAVRFENAIFTGILLIIAASVMEEARRIPVDDSEVV